MGNKQTSNAQFQTINLQQWEEVPSGQAEHPQYGEYRTFRNRHNQKLISEYQIVFADEEDFKIYLQSFIWRLRQPKIVQTMYLTEDHKNQLCSKTYSAKVYVEFIKTRLSDITDIPFPENLYVGLSMLEGYNKLYENISYFHIEENQVCVDMDGHVKVWINADLSKNYPCYGDDGMNLSYCDMVEEIIRIVTENTDKQTEPYPLQQYFKQQSHGPIGFQQAKIIISDYARKYHTKIPTYFQSIVDIYKKEQQQQYEDEQQQNQQQQEQIPPTFYNRKDVSQISEHHSPQKFRASNGMMRSQVKFYDNMGRNSKVTLNNNIQYAIPMYQPQQQHVPSYTPQFSKESSYQQFPNPYFPAKPMMHTKEFYIPPYEQKYPLQPNGHNLPPHINSGPVRMHSFPYNSPTNNYSHHQPIQFVSQRPQIVQKKITQQNNVSPNHRQMPIPMPINIDKLNNTTNSYEANHVQQMRSSVNNNSAGERSKHQRILPTIQVHSPAPLYARNSLDYSVQKSQQEIIRQQQRIIEQQRLELIQHKSSAQETNNTFKKASMFSNNSGGTNADNSKAFYYTLDTQEQLDPEIAADLKRMQQGIIG